MKFAQFQSTYKPLPIDTYERTGQELEAKFYKNREQSSLIRQAMANTKVEDRNIGILAKATTDVETMMDSVDGKWHRAGNVLYNAKDRLVNDKALNASIEDYAKSQATKQEEQKRFEEGKIDQAALNAFYKNEKRYNDKSIVVDENGQLKNRWNTPTAPPKVDTEKKVMEIATLLTQHKDSMAVGNTQLAEIYKANPGLEGFITRETASGVSGDKIANAVRQWINTTPEVKQYYDYINDANVFDAVTEKDKNGRYLKDENGEFIQKDLTPGDFRDLGIMVDDGWNTLDDKIFTTLPGTSGVMIPLQIQGASPSFKSTGIYKELREQGLSDKQATQQIYKTVLTNLQTDKIVNFGRQFGFKENDSEVIKDEGYWFRLNLRKKELDDMGIWGSFSGKAPLVSLANFDPNANKKLMEDITTKRDNFPKYSAQWNAYQNQLTNSQNTEKVLIDGFTSTFEGRDLADNLFGNFIKNIPKEDKHLFQSEENKQKVIDYITGKSTTLDIPYNMDKIIETKSSPGAGILGSHGVVQLSATNKLLDLRTNFNNGFVDAVKKGKINLDINTIDFLDKEGGISKVSENLGENILNRGDSFINIGALNRQGQPMTLDDYYKENKIDASKYKPIAQFTDHYGKFAIKFIPRDKSIDPLKDDARLVIEPNMDNKDSLMNSIVDIVKSNNAGNSNEVNKWLGTTISNILFSKVFDPVYSELSIAASNNISANKFGETWLSNVPLSAKDTKLNGDFKLVFNSDNTISLFQTDSKHSTLEHRTTKNNIPEIQDYLLNQYIK